MPPFKYSYRASTGFNTLTNIRFGSAVSGHFIPSLDNLYSIGSMTKRWAELFCTTLYATSVSFTSLVVNTLTVTTATITNASVTLTLNVANTLNAAIANITSAAIGTATITTGNITTTNGSTVNLTERLAISAPSLTDVIRIMNTTGGAGALTVFDISTYTYNPANQFPSCSFAFTDLGNFSSSIDFQTKVPGAISNSLASRLLLSHTGAILSIPLTAQSITSSTITPSSNNTFNLGSNSNQWGTLWVNTSNVAGTLTANVLLQSIGENAFYYAFTGSSSTINSASFTAYYGLFGSAQVTSLGTYSGTSNGFGSYINVPCKGVYTITLLIDFDTAIGTDQYFDVILTNQPVGGGIPTTVGEARYILWRSTISVARRQTLTFIYLATTRLNFGISYLRTGGVDVTNFTIPEGRVTLTQALS